MPFDGKRMIVGGFDPIVEDTAAGTDGLCRRLPGSGAGRQQRRPTVNWP